MSGRADLSKRQRKEHHRLRLQLAADASYEEVKGHFIAAQATLSDVANRSSYEGWEQRLKKQRLTYFSLRTAVERFNRAESQWLSAKSWGLWSSTQSQAIRRRRRRCKEILRELGLVGQTCNCAKRRPEPRWLRGAEIWPKRADCPEDTPGEESDTTSERSEISTPEQSDSSSSEEGWEEVERRSTPRESKPPLKRRRGHQEDPAPEED
jgi:hypothetical protein